MEEFNHDDVAARPHPKALMEAVLNLIVTWPELEIGLTYWISLAINLRPSETGILLGAMDTKTKINKLKALYAHRGDREAAKLLKDIAKEHKEHADVRNTIAHAKLLGASKANPDEAYFLTSMAIPDQHGFMEISRLSVADLRAAERFAKDRSKDILALLKARGLKYGRDSRAHNNPKAPAT